MSRVYLCASRFLNYGERERRLVKSHRTCLVLPDENDLGEISAGYLFFFFSGLLLEIRYFNDLELNQDFGGNCGSLEVDRSTRHLAFEM